MGRFKPVDDASEAADGAEGAVDDAEVDDGVARRFSWRASVVTCFRVSALRSLLSNAKTTWEYLWLPTSRSSCRAMVNAAAQRGVIEGVYCRTAVEL